MLLQVRLRREAPTVAARRLQLYREIEGLIAAALERELGPGEQLAARLSAASLMAGLIAVETAAAEQMAEAGRSFSGAEIDRIFDVTTAYVEAGLSSVTRNGDY